MIVVEIYGPHGPQSYNGGVRYTQHAWLHHDDDGDEIAIKRTFFQMEFLNLLHSSGLWPNNQLKVAPTLQILPIILYFFQMLLEESTLRVLQIYVTLY